LVSTPIASTDATASATSNPLLTASVTLIECGLRTSQPRRGRRRFVLDCNSVPKPDSRTTA
jgi:hypothetical protein